jgi:hypothetical protein
MGNGAFPAFRPGSRMVFSIFRFQFDSSASLGHRRLLPSSGKLPNFGRNFNRKVKNVEEGREKRI